MNLIHSIATCFLAITLCVPTMAQKRKVAPTSTARNSVQSVEQLIQNYQFNDAIHLLQKEIETAKKEGRSTLRLEQDLKRANMGFDMLRGTERLVFIDSIKVARAQFLSKLSLPSDIGRVVNTKDEANKFISSVKNVGQMAYVNSLGDRIIYSSSDSAGVEKKLHMAFRSGGKWTSPTLLDGISNVASEAQDYPFMMPDGVTLYYAAQGEESIGGYDLFVTRYNTDSKQFLKAENLGMPFNSPANDYLLAIDEQHKLGWLVTDRNQKADSVCIYVFIPNATRDVYDISSCTNKQMMHLAQLHSIAETQTDVEAVAAARKRLSALLQNTTNVTAEHHRYVINDNVVYTQLSQFKSEAARRIAEQADQVAKQISDLQQQKDDLVRQRIQNNGQSLQTINNQLKQINQSLPQLHKQYITLCKNMRKAELQ